MLSSDPFLASESSLKKSMEEPNKGKEEIQIVPMVNADLKKLVLDDQYSQYISLVHSFLKPNDVILEFNRDGCTSSCFFNDLIVHEGKSNHTVVLSKDDPENVTKACMFNIMSTSSKIILEYSSKDLAEQLVEKQPNSTVLVWGSNSNLVFEEAFASLCSLLQHLRLVVLNTDTDSTELVQKIATVLKIRNFFVHVVGKYTVFVSEEKCEKIKKINKSPKSAHLLISILIIIFAFFGLIALKQAIWG
jgi:hypothetical protein